MKKNYLAVLFTFLLLLPVMGWGQQAGSIDRSFNADQEDTPPLYFGFEPKLNCTKVQSDGKILVGGFFQELNGVRAAGIVRLNPDGSRDSSFVLPSNIGFLEVNSIEIQPDGKILVGGRSPMILRLNPNGSIDPAFDRGLVSQNSFSILTMALQADGKIIIGGGLNLFNGRRLTGLGRLNSNGTLDTTFNPNLGYRENEVNAVTIRPNGKILIGGSFDSVNNVPRAGIAQLNPDGSLDNEFITSVDYSGGPIYSGSVLSISIQSDGKTLISGRFNLFNNIPNNGFARLNLNGSLDTSFNLPLGLSFGTSNAVQPDGKILISRSFGSFWGIIRLNSNGILDSGFITKKLDFDRINIALQPNGKIVIHQYLSYIIGFGEPGVRYVDRLNSDGSFDSSFLPTKGSNRSVRCIATQADQKVIIAGEFSRYNGIEVGKIVRLNPNGNLDTSFVKHNELDGVIRTIKIQSDNKIIIGGEFRSLNGRLLNNIARLHVNGILDTTFNPGTGANGYVRAIDFQSDGKIIIGGDFTSYNGTSRSKIVRLNSDGSIDNTFNVGVGIAGIYNPVVNSVNVLPDGKIIVSGDFNSYNGTNRNCITRLNTDGSVDTSFNPGTGLNSYGSVYSTSLQTDGKLIIGGYFGSYNGISRGNIARLNMNGTLDSTFNPGTGAFDLVYSAVIQEAGKIVIGGGFYSFNGVESRAIIRVNPNGGLDNSFRSGTGFFGIGNVNVFAMAQVDNGKIIVAGEFTSYNGSGFKNIARIHLGGCFAPTISGNRTICIGGSTTLISSVSTGNIWSNGDTTQSITVTEAGSYSVRVVNGSCTTAVSNAINVVITPALSTPTISGSTTFCLGGSTTLTSSAETGNLWSTGDTTRSLTVNTAGNYSVRVVSGACASAISNPITVSVTSPAAPQIAFDSAGNRCLGSEIIMSVAGTYNQYRWNNGATTRSIAVRGTGAFSAEVLDSTGCWSLPSRTANIVFDTAFCQIRITIVGIDSLEASVYADRYEWFLDGIQLLSGNNGRRILIQGDGVYTVRAIIGNRNSALSNPITITSSKKSLAKTAFEVFPNPATDKVTIKTTGTGTLEILNTLGQVVISQPATEINEINITKLAKGVYTVRFNGVGQKLIVK